MSMGKAFVPEHVSYQNGIIVNNKNARWMDIIKVAKTLIPLPLILSLT